MHLLKTGKAGDTSTAVGSSL